MTLEKRAFAGAFAGSINIVLTLGQAVLLVPIFLQWWGSEQYGVWLAVLAAYGLLTALDGGHQNFLGNEFNRLHVLDLEASRRVLDNALLIGLLLGALEFVLTIGLMSNGPADNLLGLESGRWIVQARLALIILVAAWAFTGSVGGILVRIYTPKGLFARAQWLGVLGRLLQLIATILVVTSGGGLVAVAVAIATVSLAFNVFLFLDVYKSAPEYWPWLRRPSLRNGASLLGKSMVLVGTGVLQQFSINGLTMMVSTVLTAMALPGFVTSRTIANMLVQVSAVVVQPLYPDLVKYRVENDPARLRALLLGIWFVTSLLVNVLIVGMFPFLRPLYLWWTGHVLAFDEGLVTCLLISVAVKCYGLPFLSCLAALNNLREQIICAAVQICITLVAAKLLLAPMGTLGLGLAIIGGEVAGGALLPIWFVRLERDQVGAGLMGLHFLWHAWFAGISIGAVLAMFCFSEHLWIIFLLSMSTLLVLAYRRVRHLPVEVRTRFERYLSWFKRQPLVT